MSYTKDGYTLGEVDELMILTIGRIEDEVLALDHYREMKESLLKSGAEKMNIYTANKEEVLEMDYTEDELQQLISVLRIRVASDLDTLAWYERKLEKLSD
jgi:hypothetical protein